MSQSTDFGVLSCHMGAGGGSLSLSFHICEMGVFRASSLGFEVFPVLSTFWTGEFPHVGRSTRIQSTVCRGPQQRETTGAGRE